MKTARDIVESVGREKIKARFGVADRTIRHNLEKGVLPSNWYAALCEMTGHERLPHDLFSFKGMEQ